MQIDRSSLQNCTLFAGISAADLRTLLLCLRARKRRFDRNTFIFSSDRPVTSVCVILSGAVQIVQEDFWGNRSVLAELESADLFGEAFSFAGAARLPVSTIAIEKTTVLMLDYARILTPCPSMCGCHLRLFKNLIQALSEKNLALMQKLDHVSKRTTREKLLAYLSEQAILSGGNIFDIPLNRQELADYLSVDRSAMSTELSRMQKDGIMSYDKHHFELHAYRNNTV